MEEEFKSMVHENWQNFDVDKNAFGFTYLGTKIKTFEIGGIQIEKGKKKKLKNLTVMRIEAQIQDLTMSNTLSPLSK